MKFLSENKIENKRVILRCDFNVSIENNKIIDNSKIISSLKTINYLLDNNNKVIILSHFGRVKNEEEKKSNSLKIVYEELKKYLNISFIDNPLDLDIITSVTDSNCFLVENTRFTDIPEKRESVNDLELARYWAKFADVFVFDAFASSHRIHSSTAGLSKYLPTYIGFLMEEELKKLVNLVNNPLHPFIVIMGGAKVDDKIKIMEALLNKCDKLIITGGILNAFLKVSNKNIDNSLVSTDEEVLNNVKNVLKMYSNKLYFTDNFVVNRNNSIINTSINDIKNDDIIYDNIPNIKNLIKDAKIIFLNGTCGKYEIKEYQNGTIKLFNELKEKKEIVYIGGGDTISSLNKLGFKETFKNISTGGGATLEYVAYGKLKALEWIKENGVDN